MKGFRRHVIVGVLLLPGAGAFLAGFGHAASADTACADLWIERESASPMYLAGPGNCKETGQPRALHVWEGHKESGTVPPGYPAGYGVDVWVTAPPPP
jgi:hypothetical protein